MKDKKVVFMGTPTFAVPILKYLIEATNVVLVVSQPNREKDRKGNLIDTPIKTLADTYNIPVFQPNKIKEEYQYIIDYQPDIIITCAYGQIIPIELLEYPKYKCINIHGSLLPKYRGGAPIHHAIIDGEKETGITIMYMDKKMDSGDIISKRSIPIREDDTLDYIYNEMSNLGMELLKDTLPSIFNNTNARIKQDESLVSFGLNITKEEEKINFDRTARDIHNQIRGLSSIPGAYCLYNDKRMKVYGSVITTIKSKGTPGMIVSTNKQGIYVNTKDYQIILTDIKVEGKKRCLAKDYLNGIDKKELIGCVLK